MSTDVKRFEIGEVIVKFPPEQEDNLKFFKVSKLPENYAGPITVPVDGQRYCVEILNPESAFFQPIPLLIITVKPADAHKWFIYNKEFKDKHAEHLL
jgi:hypothetical protein